MFSQNINSLQWLKFFAKAAKAHVKYRSLKTEHDKVWVFQNYFFMPSAT
jgi:hypothetical protein